MADPRSGGTPAARSAHTAGEQADAGKPAAQTPIAPGTVRLCISPDLRFLMPLRRRAAGQMDMAYDPTATVGHLVQSAGVPLTEVGDLLVSDVPVSWSDRLHDQDRLDVAVRARPQPLDGPAIFLLDVHLGALARRLRLLGIDTAYGNDADDDDLVEQAQREDRVLLSQDRGLLKRRTVRRAALVRGQQPDAQLDDVIERFRPPMRPWMLCLACGGALVPVAKAEVAGRLPPGTLRTQHRFARCVACGHVYWHGAHDPKLRQVVGRYT